MRRVLRIFPPLYVTVTLAILLVVFGVLPSHTNWLAAASHYLFFTNYFALTAPVDSVAGMGPLWSLAVEEHFYLLFPLVFSLYLARRSGKSQAAILFFFCAVVLVHRTIVALYLQSQGVALDSGWTYLATDTRLDSIAYGCILALWRNPVLDEEVRQKPPSMVWFWGGLGVLLFCLVVRDQLFRETLRYSLQGLALMPIFTVAILRHDRFPFTLLNNWLVKWVAAFSYTIYLIHYVAFDLVKHYVTEEPWMKGILAALIVTGYAWLIYLLAERPVVGLRKKFV
jgi:peptidoglycan/LPS O-acetylase OafA/YrhL